MKLFNRSIFGKIKVFFIFLIREISRKLIFFFISIWESVKSFFIAINWGTFKSSISEVLWLTFFALLPFILYVIITGVSINNLYEAFISKVIPGEFLSYCFGFLAPSMYLFLVKRNSTTYNFPFLHIITWVVLFIYVANVVLYLIVKNNWVPQINMERHEMDLYFKLVLLFLILSIFLRLYAVYHSKRILDWQGERERQQALLNQGFANILNQAK